MSQLVKSADFLDRHFLIMNRSIHGCFRDGFNPRLHGRHKRNSFIQNGEYRHTIPLFSSNLQWNGWIRSVCKRSKIQQQGISRTFTRSKVLTPVSLASWLGGNTPLYANPFGGSSFNPEKSWSSFRNHSMSSLCNVSKQLRTLLVQLFGRSQRDTLLRSQGQLYQVLQPSRCQAGKSEYLHQCQLPPFLSEDIGWSPSKCLRPKGVKQGQHINGRQLHQSLFIPCHRFWWKFVSVLNGPRIPRWSQTTPQCTGISLQSRIGFDISKTAVSLVVIGLIESK